MIKLLNVQDCPEMAKIDLGTFKLNFTRHAQQRAIEKKITIKNDELRVTAGSVVEVEIKGDKWVKLLIRISYDNHRDIVFVVVPLYGPEVTVKTVWLNSKEDNFNRYKKQAA